MASACRRRPATIIRFTPVAVGGDAEEEAAGEAGEALDAVDRDRGHGGDAAEHGVAQHVEDRAGVRGAAEEEGAGEDERTAASGARGRRRPRRRLGRRRAAAAGAARTKRAAGMRSAQARTPMAAIAVRQSWVEISQPAKGVMVIGAMPMPAETRRDGERAAGGEPAGDGGDHRGEEGAGGEADDEAEAELEGEGRGGAAGDDEAEPEEDGADEDHRARAPAVAERCPRGSRRRP